jgi:hypothetical protein
MSTRTNSFMHPVRNITPIASVNTSYATARRHTLALGSFPAGSAWIGHVSSIVIQVSSIAGGAKEVSFLLSEDAGGDIVLGSATGEFEPGVTTATDGGLTIVLEFILSTPTDDTVYMFYKVDAGTVTVDSVTINWKE